MSWFFKSWRPAEKKDQARELRIATSESYSIRTSVEPLSVDGAGSYTSASKLRAALFVPEQSMTIKFHPESTKKSAARGQCVHSIEMFTRSETATILEDARRVGASIGWSDRGVSLPTQDVLVQHLSKESQDAVHRAIREKLLPFARRHYPHLNGALDKQPYPRPGNLFIVRYCASSARPGGRGLKLHKARAPDRPPARPAAALSPPRPRRRRRRTPNARTSPSPDARPVLPRPPRRTRRRSRST